MLNTNESPTPRTLHERRCQSLEQVEWRCCCGGVVERLQFFEGLIRQFDRLFATALDMVAEHCPLA